MSLWRYLETKSPQTKARFAFGIASVSTFIIAIIWLSTLPSRFNTPVSGGMATEEKTGMEEFVNIFKESKDQLGNVITGNNDSEETPEVKTNLDMLTPPGSSDSSPYSLQMESSASDGDETAPQSESSSKVILIATSTSAENP